jgi:hypothetical protein
MVLRRFRTENRKNDNNYINVGVVIYNTNKHTKKYFKCLLGDDSFDYIDLTNRRIAVLDPNGGSHQ